MKNSASMRPDILLVTTQGVKGGKHHTNRQGQCRIAVAKGYNEPVNAITVDAFKGMGHSYEPAETALINISFADGTQFNGTFDSLQKIVAAKQGKKQQTNTSFCIGYGRLISENLIGTMVDLQSIVVTNLLGEPVCWIHEWKKAIYPADEAAQQYIPELINNSILSERINDYTIEKTSSRKWGIKSTFQYPN